MFFKNLSVRAKLWLLVFVAALMLLVMTSMAVLDMRQSMQEERKAQLSALLDSSLGMLASFQARVEAGELSRDEAIGQARSLLESMHYAGREYFFVLNSKAEVVVHGGDPSQVGRSVKAVKSPDGVPVFAQMAGMIGGNTRVGEFSYLWPRPGSEGLYPKLTLAKPFNPWGWVLATGVYVDDLQAAFIQDLIRLGVQMLVALMVLVLCTIPIGRAITVPLDTINDVMRRAAEGDLRARAGLTSHDELGKVGARIDETLGVFQELVHQIAGSSTQLAASAEELARSAEETSAALDLQAQEAEQLSTAMNEMAASVHEVARSAGETASAIENVDHEADQGNHDVENTVERIQALAREIDEAADVIQALDDDMVQVGQVLGQIEAISEQTNLLALNAAIEAARAGESGRGFAVVADEIRQLAQRTQGSTEEIHTMNDRLRAAAQRAVEVMGRAKERAEASVATAQHTGKELIRIVEQMARIRDMGVQVAAAAEEQSQVSEEMNANLLRITQASESTVAAANTVAANGEQLQQLSRTLQQQIDRFHA
jgi:methyl-accepting chemotaxis protein